MADPLKPALGFLLLIVVLFLLQTTVTCKKPSSMSLVENIIDAKELKKLCRTRNNVLILFTKSTRQSSELINVFSKAAEVIRGQASLALVDCSGDAKKLCRKLKVSPEPHILKHYKDGEYHKDYDRKHTVQILGKLLSREKLPIMVMFYAPWCGFCKRLKPEYEAVATELKKKAIMAAMDVNKPENAVVRQHFNITGFPTLLYFEKGQMKHKYDGDNNRDGLLNFMKNPDKQPEKPKEEEWADNASEVYHLTDENFNSVLESELSALVMFYAPWCGHCKKMKPEFEAAAASMKEQDFALICLVIQTFKLKFFFCVEVILYYVIFLKHLNNFYNKFDIKCTPLFKNSLTIYNY
ncbi:UNVERIFIED_CONTAM: Pdia5 [Trichonephila clavipes]